MGTTTLIVSDLHLIPEFNKRKYEYLVNIIKKADKLIVNGDLWSYYYCNFSDFVKSEWNKLFPLMLEKGCVYIHGNHDRKKWCDENTKLFSTETHEKYSFSQNGVTFHVSHGHQMFRGTFNNKTLHKYLNKYQMDKYNHALQKLIIEKLGIENYHNIGAHFNKKHKKISKIFTSKDVQVCGHTHCPEISLENSYINTGLINFGFGSYILVDENISLVRERY